MKQSTFDRFPSATLEFSSGESIRIAALWWEQPNAPRTDVHDANWVEVGLDARLASRRWRSQGSFLSWELVGLRRAVTEGIASGVSNYRVLEGIFGLQLNRLGGSTFEVTIELAGEFLPLEDRWDPAGLRAAPEWRFETDEASLAKFARQLGNLGEAFPVRDIGPSPNLPTSL